jgi:hypothetical protein
VRSFFSGVVSILAFAIITALSDGGLPVGALAGVAVVLIVAGVLATRWIPRPTHHRGGP